MPLWLACVWAVVVARLCGSLGSRLAVAMVTEGGAAGNGVETGLPRRNRRWCPAALWCCPASQEVRSRRGTGTVVAGATAWVSSGSLPWGEDELRGWPCGAVGSAAAPGTLSAAEGVAVTAPRPSD